MIMNTSNSDSSCAVLENDVSVIELDASAELAAEAKLAESDDNTQNASILKICFKDSATYSELSNLIAKCVKNALLYLQKSVILTEDSSTFTLTFNETSTADNNLFIVDSVPAPEVANLVPEYEVIINEASVDQTKDDQATAQNTCFNCNGNHAIKDCMKPKDLAKIKQNRAKFSSNKMSYERYHVDAEQKYGHLVAGELSKDLRNALGLRSKELPVHIYRMRVLGYPPGWLEHAKVSGSGLSMFDSEGKETDANESEDEDKFDLKKIISFPGFNVEPPHGTRDDSRSYRAPPMQHHHSKAVMIEHFRSKSTKAYKRKSVRNTDTDITVLEPTDMDIDDESDDNDLINVPLGERLARLEDDSSTPAKLPKESHPKPSPPASPAPMPSENKSPLSDGEIADNELSRADSPSLDDLNERKKRLLNALDDSAVSITTLTKRPSDDDSLIDDILALQDDSALDSSAINDENGDTSTIDASQSTIGASPPATPNIHSLVNKSVLHVSKETVGGTPVIKGVSPFGNLPQSEKWREGVSDVLDFENLPESIGKYEKMRTLIEKVRVKVKKIQYEDEDR
ncbi:hypothetical protein HA402_015884 [Bradysia odoriphaga]|nr:hypothetical protein HA402_015884 [Bradysia odoriphaga]